MRSLHQVSIVVLLLLACAVVGVGAATAAPTCTFTNGVPGAGCGPKRGTTGDPAKDKLYHDLQIAIASQIRKINAHIGSLGLTCQLDVVAAIPWIGDAVTLTRVIYESVWGSAKDAALRATIRGEQEVLKRGVKMVPGLGTPLDVAAIADSCGKFSDELDKWEGDVLYSASQLLPDANPPAWSYRDYLAQYNAWEKGRASRKPNFRKWSTATLERRVRKCAIQRFTSGNPTYDVAGDPRKLDYVCVKYERQMAAELARRRRASLTIDPRRTSPPPGTTTTTTPRVDNVPAG